MRVGSEQSGMNFSELLAPMVKSIAAYASLLAHRVLDHQNSASRSQRTPRLSSQQHPFCPFIPPRVEGIMPQPEQESSDEPGVDRGRIG